jgi:hypothetical protein
MSTLPSNFVSSAPGPARADGSPVLLMAALAFFASWRFKHFFVDHRRESGFAFG